jgi:anaerobic magnesium-protoporphyrin IX monomethyl ester cyclase
MKILLINSPPRKKKMFANFIIPPIGLSYVASALKRDGFDDVKILDANALQMGWDELEKYLKSNGPFDVIGLTGMTPIIDRSYRAIKIARKHCKHIVLGGPHASIYVEQCFKDCPEIDFLVLQEGELTAPLLFKKLETGKPVDGLKGIAFKRKGKVVVNPSAGLIEDLDSVPLPARELLPMDKYRYPISKHKKVDVVITSRGCPYNCIFCNKVMFGNKWRARSAKNVVDEIESVIREYGIKSFIFYDDLFTFDMNRVKEICRMMIDRKMSIEWKCEGRVNIMDKEMLDLMKKAGCTLISYGVESCNQKSLNFLRKGTTPEQIRNAFRMTKDAGIETMAYLIIGIPGETKEDAINTIEFAEEIDADYVQISVLTPMEKTPLHDLAKEKGWIRKSKAKNPFDAETERDILSTGDIPPEEIEALVKEAHRRFLLNKKYLLKSIKRIRSMNQLKNLVITGMDYLYWLMKGDKE